MKKSIPSILIFSTLATLMSAPFTHALNANDILEMNVYHSDLGFSAVFPDGWETRIMENTTLNWGEYGTATALNIGFPESPDMITISRYEVDQWNNIITNVDGPLPTMLGVTDNFVLASNFNQQTINTEGHWVIDHITVHKQSLSDIEGHQNEHAIQYLLDNLIIAGYPDGTFQPEQSINRAELMKILTEASGAMPDKEAYNNCFPDVTNQWFAHYVCYAKEQNWIQGYPDGTFKPANNVNKVEALKMIINSQDLRIPGSVNETSFDDVDTNAWYALFVKAAENMGLLEQTEGTYGVDEAITRSEVSENIYRALLVNLIDSIDGTMGEPETTTESPLPDTAEPEEVLATISGYAVFNSASFNFSVEYPEDWFYEGINPDPFSNVRTYHFGPGLDEEESPLVVLEIRSGEAPDGTIVETNDRELVLTEEENQTNVYYTGDQTGRLFRLFADPALEEVLLNMGSSIIDKMPEEESGY